jgi:ketosteroid isomerase-like protein
MIESSPHPEERRLRRISKDETISAFMVRDGARARLLTMRMKQRSNTMNKDIDELTALNRDYVASVQNSDVKRFDEILAQDFYCSNPDKSLVDRAGFLKQTAIPVTIRNLEAHDVRIRVMGDFAIIHARTSYTTPDGQQASGRYTDCWAKQNGRWLAVSAHVSR